MKITVEYYDTDIAKLLNKIIKHNNKDEFVKLLTPMICQHSNAANAFFKIHIADSENALPEVYPKGTLVKIKPDNLGYGANKDLVEEKFADEEGLITVTIQEFRGYHEHSNYKVEFMNVLHNGSTNAETTFISMKDIVVIDDF